MPTVHFDQFSQEDITAFQPALKVGILATVNPEGLPHLTFISTLMASDPKTVVWGQFVEGSSKEYIRQNPKTAFLIMTLDKNTWRGKATFTHTQTSGKDYDFYNNVPMFRYNAYFGVHTVYYMDLVEHNGKQPLPMPAIVFSSVATLLAKILSPGREEKQALNPWTKSFISKIGIPKFLAYIGSDGYPVIIPVFQATAPTRDHVIFTTSAYKDELKTIPKGIVVAILGLSLEMEVVLLRGIYQGISSKAGFPCGTVQINWVYNPMPPKPMQIYPETDIQAVLSF
ncbi:MAG: pyridoxamine 5'-phosphate oxidase family protein [Anaerolineae bacterium]|nr:pyridoxamine 5'-phosphate oxidase family protein [Anaerolineae bacterium]